MTMYVYLRLSLSEASALISKAAKPKICKKSVFRFVIFSLFFPMKETFGFYLKCQNILNTCMSSDASPDASCTCTISDLFCRKGITIQYQTRVDIYQLWHFSSSFSIFSFAHRVSSVPVIRSMNALRAGLWRSRWRWKVHKMFRTLIFWDCGILQIKLKLYKVTFYHLILYKLILGFIYVPVYIA